jgi:hypothetical protein
VERLRGGSGMKISDCCALLGFSKQAYYKQRIHHEKQSLEKDVLLREVLIIRQSLPVLGGRKLYALLDQRLPSTLLPGRDKFFEFLDDMEAEGFCRTADRLNAIEVTCIEDIERVLEKAGGEDPTRNMLYV